jgi:phage tail sheath protein FI
MGFDCSSATTMGTTVYKKAINAVSNPDEFDINLLVTPGIVHGLHSKVSARAMNMCEERGDTFYVMDASIHGESISTITSRVSTLDTNYAAVYYPWVKIVDSGTSLPVWVPPSVVLPRLLIRLKKFIASSSRYLVFEQNTAGTRNRFLNIVNPFLDSVQANSGLSAFRVVMDESNNTPDVVDRNRLVGQIYIQPTRTAEFIVLDFVVLPTGATFPE